MDEKTTAGNMPGAPESTPDRTGKRGYRKSAASSSASRANLVSAWEARKKGATKKWTMINVPIELLEEINALKSKKTAHWKVVSAGLKLLAKQAQKKV